jgi:CTP:molybdopterin cytidylyltransferase MocA
MIPAVILAAGKSTRMGVPKPALAFDEHDSFLTHIVRTFQTAAIDDVVVVAGYQAEAVAALLAKTGTLARVILNHDYESGQLSSILAGLRAIDRPGVRAMLLTLVDVPLVSPDTVRAVLKRYRATGAPVVRPVHNGRHGHPIVIDRSLFDRLRHADPVQGAKPIVRGAASSAGDVEVDDEGAFADIDTPADYARLLGRPLRVMDAI